MLTFDEIDFDINDVAEGVVDLFAGRALSKGIDLSLIVADDVPDVFVGDPGRLRQVIAAHLSEQNNKPELARAALAGALNCSESWIGLATQDDGFDWREA